MCVFVIHSCDNEIGDCLIQVVFCGVCLVTLLSGCVLDCVVDFMHECGDFKGMIFQSSERLNGKVG